jgi:hypothetical protein
METIKNYLDAMFANMPNTPEVKKAKAELFSMMEDKYNELIAEGVSENTAVGTVISEFGNLDELAQDLGLTKEVEEVHEREQQPKRFVSMDEALEFIRCEKKRALLVATGVLLCITCVCWPIVTDAVWGFMNIDNYGAAMMFVWIAVGVGLFIYSSFVSSDFSFLRKEPCQMDMATTDMIKEKKAEFKPITAAAITLGCALCICAVVPIMIFDIDIFATFIFIMVGIGVWLFVYSGIINSSFDTLLDAGNVVRKDIKSNGNEEDVEYVSKGAKILMESYWSIVTCLYLIISFTTFNWGSTWIIWVIAAIAHKVFKIALVKED